MSASTNVPAAGSSSPTPSVTHQATCRASAYRGWRTLQIGDERRTFYLRSPASKAPRPLVVLFHGYAESAKWIDHYTGFSRRAARLGFVTAIPQGVDGRWNFARNPAVGTDDVRFVSRIIARLHSQECVDPARVFVTGFSDGADMANELACADHRQVAAVAGVAASVVPRGCRLPTRVLEIHGTADPVVPYDGGGAQRPPPYQDATPVSVARQMLAWRKLDGCSSSAERRPLSRTVRLVAFGSCSPGRVELMVIRDGGHTWPGARVHLPYGKTDESISATEEILTFFS